MDVICEKTTNLREKINDFFITASFWTWSEGSLWYLAEVILVKWHLRASKSCPDEIKQVGHGYKGKAWKCELLGGYFRKAETQTFDCSSLLIIKKVVFFFINKTSCRYGSSCGSRVCKLVHSDVTVPLNGSSLRSTAENPSLWTSSANTLETLKLAANETHPKTTNASLAWQPESLIWFLSDRLCLS